MHSNMYSKYFFENIIIRMPAFSRYKRCKRYYVRLLCFFDSLWSTIPVCCDLPNIKGSLSKSTNLSSGLVSDIKTQILLLMLFVDSPDMMNRELSGRIKIGARYIEITNVLGPSINSN